MGVGRRKDEPESVRIQRRVTAACASQDPSLKTQPLTFMPPLRASQAPAAPPRPLPGAALVPADAEPCVWWEGKNSMHLSVFHNQGKCRHRQTGIPVTVVPSTNWMLLKVTNLDSHQYSGYITESDSWLSLLPSFQVNLMVTQTDLKVSGYTRIIVKPHCFYILRASSSIACLHKNMCYTLSCTWHGNLQVSYQNNWFCLIQLIADLGFGLVQSSQYMDLHFISSYMWLFAFLNITFDIWLIGEVHYKLGPSFSFVIVMLKQLNSRI